MTIDANQSAAASPSMESVPEPSKRPEMVNVFVGPNGIRAGWRLLIFFVVIAAILTGIQFGMRMIPSVRAYMRAQDPRVMTPAAGIIGEGVGVFSLMMAVLVMSHIEKRSVADYYLPPDQAFGKRFWQGIPYGLAMLSLLMALIAAFHGFSLGGLALSGSDALKYGAMYGIVFILVGLFEEFSFRGYLQYTLGSGIGFWLAAIILSIAFGAIHLNNLGEAWFGALMAGSFGLLAAFALSRTGNIWFPIGMHAGWDWGETYLYSAPDSGSLAKGHLLNSSFHGPTWLTGGTVGPEGSAFVFLVLALSAVGIHFLFPVKQTTISTRVS